MRLFFASVFLVTTTAFANIAAQVQILAPRVVQWAQEMEVQALREGVPLDARARRIARAVGVRDPGRIRLIVGDGIPLPTEPVLRAAAQQVGISPATSLGMTLGHAVFVRRGLERDARLLSHEFRHVAQYEEAGGIAGFLARHLVDLAADGYENSPYEVDARAHELSR
jgi:hypothetical protein